MKVTPHQTDDNQNNMLHRQICTKCRRQILSQTKLDHSSVPYKSSRFKNACLRDCISTVPHRWLVVFVLLWLPDMTCLAQQQGEVRTFPPPRNVAKERPIITVPADSTCGVPARNAYCVSSTDASSVQQCVQGFCEQTCGQNSRTRLPNFDNLLIATSAGFATCVDADTVNRRPGSEVTQYSTSITASGPDCFVSTDLSPSAGINGSFTITAWIWIGQDVPGTLLEKSAVPGESILRVDVAPEGVNVSFSSQSGEQVATLVHSIGQRNWTHLAVQVYGRSVSFFINGIGDDYTATSTEFLDDEISDTTGSFRLGQSDNGTMQFIGKMQDVHFYSTTLSNREIQEIYTGTLPPVRVQSSCRCPPATPRVKPQNELYCLSNGVPDNAGDATLRVSEFSHPVEYANDEDVNTVWISKFQNEVSLEVDLGDQFEVFHVGLEFYSPLPKAITIERFYTGSDRYQPWQYYAENCTTFFAMENNGALTNETTVNCIMFGSNNVSVPYSKGSVTFYVVASDRPGFSNYYSNQFMQQFVQASRVRVRLQDHFYVDNIRHEYFGLYEFRVNGRCACNGHAESCNMDTLPYKCVCSEESHTQGDRCNECQPLYNNKPFRQGDLKNANNCIRCQCYNHSDACVYNATVDSMPFSSVYGSGGVCINCRDNTEGMNCDMCKDTYFRPEGKSMSDIDVCSQCNCFPAGTVNAETVCNKLGGQCPCKVNVDGRACSQCRVGFYNLTAVNREGCMSCGCSSAGTVNGNLSCNQTSGQCFCKRNVRGKQCSECQYGFYNLNASDPIGCTPCSCNPQGSQSMACNPEDGQCLCKNNVEGLKCDQCVDNFFNFSAGCIPCNCNRTGTENNTICDKITGQCVCKAQTTGRQCSECKPGSSSFGNSPDDGCEKCICEEAGVPEGNIDCSNTCPCKENVMGFRCNKCKENHFNLTKENPLGCEPCNCDLSGVNSPATCDDVEGRCSCLPFRIGRRCDDCQEGRYKNETEQGGCLPCNCDPEGTMPGTTCNSQTGDCSCRVSDGVGGAKCDECIMGYYGFRRGVCTPCNCLPAGSLSTDCNRATGQCQCKENVEGQQCDRCVAGASNLQAQNPFGCSKQPSQQPAPIYTPLSPTSMNISWSPPDFPNGVIEQYRLFRNGTMVFNGSSRYHVDTGLQPYTLYSYRVEAVNADGSVSSPPVVFRTNPGTPSSDMQLQVNEIEVASATFSWTPPSNMNGPLLKYQLVSHKSNNETDTEVEWEGTETQATLASLRPYQRYNLTVRACTEGGCSESQGVTFTTKTAAPTNMQPPTITAINSSTLFVEWEPPLNPNGIISFYELWIRGLPGPNGQPNPPESRIYNPGGQYDPLNPEESIMQAPPTSFNVTGLRPFTVYEFLVLAENEAGRAASPWTAGRTKETFPVFMPAPAVVGLSSTQVQVSWTAPSLDEARGNITAYRLYQNMARNLTADPFASPLYWQLVNETEGTEHSQVVSGLKPYELYDFMVEACNNIGCVNSTASSGRTLSAAPEGVGKPVVDSYNSTVMEVKWRPPSSPNGPTPLYTVQKTNIALSYPASVVRGTRFPGGGYYAFPAETLPQNVDFTGIRFEFRLKQESGLLLFAASENHQEYVAVLFNNGRPRFMYDTRGDCETEVEVNITLPENINLTSLADSEVHTLEVVRLDGGNGSILVDGVYSGKGRILDRNCQDSKIIGPTTELFVGGLPHDFVFRRTENSVLKKVIGQNFQGCIHKVQVLKQMHPFEVWEELDWASAISYELAFLNWQGCPINLERGLHFMGKGYMVIPNCDGSNCLLQGDADEIKLSFNMRTSLHTGVLFISHGGSGIYMLAYLQNNSIVFEFSGNDNKTEVRYYDPAVTLCDANWHHIEFRKTKGQGSISVDGGPRSVSGNPTEDKPVPVLSPVYLGGIKPNSPLSVFLTENEISIPTEGFGGCIKNVLLNDEALDMSKLRDLVNVNMDGCPPFHIPKDTCESSLITDIYSGADLSAYDYGLLPYTDYIYRVVAKNAVGEASSPWGYGRTREGAPVGVGPPTGVRVLSGYMVEVEWEEPQSTSGLLTKTIISAYNMEDQDRPPVSVEVLDINAQAINMTELTPNTNYKIKISACTSGGCTESADGVDVLTPVEAPEEVAAPTASNATATTLLVSWDPPAKPNGNITGYFLYRDGTEVYSGGEQQFLVEELRVYTSYEFYVRACTSAGCSDGPKVSLSTAQMPPTVMETPTLTVLGARSIEVRWDKPEELNGVLERYLIYLSTTEGEEGEVVHNTTMFFPSHNLVNLTAGTTYYISVAACTGGGCTVSNASSATTAESSPSGIVNPTVTSPSPSQLFINWSAPLSPNGEITSYELDHNGVQIQQGLNLSYELDGLAPYSLHEFRLRVCTAQGCGVSGLVQARTQEAPPEGNVVLTASVVDARTVNTSWTRPLQANGQLFFNVYFRGTFYVDPENWNYTTVVERRSLLRETTSYKAFLISPLVPMADYNVEVNASNTKGFILSNVVAVTMPAGSPDGMKPPVVVSDTPVSMTVTWDPVGRVNAPEEVAYLVQFRQTEGDVIIDDFGPTTTFAYRKTGLSPFTSYQFRVVASNSRGSTPSLWVTNTTQQDKPSGVFPPRIADVQSRTIVLTWAVPTSPNGIITAYRIYQNTQLREELSGSMTNYTVEGLTPYQQYSFQVEACTVAGCTLSETSSSARTLQAVAEGIAAPRLRVLTPAMIEVQWSEPLGVNGIISQYVIERRLASGGSISTVGTFQPSDPKSLIDESPVLSPFTTYSYRVKVVNGAGTGEGPWANVTTSSSRPAGVSPPVLTVLNATSMRVTWSEPLQSNGVIEYYVLEWAESRREIRNFTVLSIVLNDLTPYTDYSVKVAACTTGGCTESIPATARTLPAIPSGQAPPTATAISQSAVSVSWSPPSGPNGPNLRYELARKKIRQPLDASFTGPGAYQSVYSGTDGFYEDRNLTMFTTYVYRVTAFNSIGQTISADSAEVTTFGGFPRRAPLLSAAPLSHREIFVNWTMPDPVDLQGDIQFMNLTARSLQGSVTANPAVGTDSFTMQDLTASTNYNISLTVTIFGGASITSEPVNISTQDGAPEGIPAPVLSVVSNTALRVTWIVPQQPNGEITAYNLIVNGETIPTGSTVPGSRILENLRPYTVYDVKVEACTVFKCAQSESTLGTTQEALPLGIAAPTLTVLNSTAVQLDWQAPTQPNGIILRYDVVRKALQSCSNIPTPEVSPEDSKCTYIECSILERVCGTSCFSGTKTCCDGVVHDMQSGYACCGTSYLAKPSLDAVCCGGKFYEAQADFQCCGTRYVQVLAGETCCVSPVEDRVAVGMGDSCCAAVPYSSAGAQICCSDVLVGGYGRQCCGGDVVTDTSVCCGDAAAGKAYLSQTDHSCCGQLYTANTTTLCCQSDTGHTKVHYYESKLQKDSANEKCCGLEKISNPLSCCNYMGYSSVTQVCADRSSQVTGCGTGVVCPVTQASSAFCNRCDFDATTTVCGSVPGHYIANTTTPAPPAGNGSVCHTGEEKIYTGLDLSFTDTALLPHSQYQYAVRVVNSAGTTGSPWADARTLEAPPAGVSPPVTRINPEQLYLIYLSWSQPQQPNGEIIRYTLVRDGVEVYRGMATNFTDDRNVLPFKTYTYMLSACTTAGCSNSPEVTVATAQGIPEDIPPPVVTVLSSTSVQVAIQPPNTPNGQVVQYTVLIVGNPRKYSVQTPQNILLEGLVPYSNYTVYVEACTVVGCANSPNATVTTAETKPVGVDPPTVVVMTASSVDVYWKPPRVLNGQLQAYTIILEEVGTRRTVYSGTNLTTTITDLIPGRSYKFYLNVSTNGGSTQSLAHDITMPTSTPLDVPPPHTVNILSATQMMVAWDAVNSTEGTIDQYRVLLNMGLDTEEVTGVGLALSVTLSGLRPYTEYSVRLQACLAGIPNGCGTSEAVVNRTFEAPPTGQAPPTLTALASDTVKIDWQPPANPNGLITAYHIFLQTGADDAILINQVGGNTLTFTHSSPDRKPYTLYYFGIVAFNSRGQTQMAFAPVRTLEAPPTGLANPTVTVAGAYGVSVAWQPPEKPNGIISQYRVYYKMSNSGLESSVTVNGNTTSTTISGLNPYSQYVIRLEAVNKAGSVSSNETTITTEQASPSGLQDFTVEKITTGNAVILRWEPPLRPNGIITTYRVYEMSDAENSVYMGIARLFEFRRLQPFTEYSVKLEACTLAGCTLGKEQKFVTAEIPPTAQPIPTTGTVTATSVVLRWSAPMSANGRITSYEVFRRATPLRRRRQADPGGEAGEVVYRTMDTDGDNYEYTDTGLRPYTKYEYKIRASNSQGFTDSPWQTVQTSQAAPEGVSPPQVSHIEGDVNSLNVSWSPPSSPNGVLQSYRLRQNESLPFSLPPDGNLHYVYRDLQAYTWYSFTVTVCSGGGCTTSDPTVIRTKEAAPLTVSPPTLTPVDATTIQANWSVPQVTNGEITRYQLTVDGNTAYEGLGREYTASSLTPYQEYTFQLTACTVGGCTQSVEVMGRPDESSPTDMGPPVLRVISSTAIEVSWSAPQNPNGVITAYNVKRDGNLIFTTQDGQLKTSYTDYELQAGEEYSYTVVAHNSRGNVESPPSQARTSSTSPSGLQPPTLTPVSSASIQATWLPPSNPNGQIVNYTLYQGNSLVYSGAADQLTYTVPGLSFFTEYTFRLQACTQGGCGLSLPATAKTLEAPPEQLEAPTLTALAGESGAHQGVRATWRAPVRPNGVLLYYQLQRRIVNQTASGDIFGDVILVFNNTDMEYTDTDPRLRPYQRYQYMAIAVNAAGKANSQWADVVTKQAPPIFVDPPVIVRTTATTITVRVTEPKQPNGIVNRYNILIDGRVVATGLSLELTAGEPIPLDPFTTYTITAQACTAGGCTNSTSITGRTAASDPTGLRNITVVAVNRSAVSLAWEQPANPNGQIRRFLVYQRSACPHPVQPFVQVCVEGDPAVMYDGLGTSALADGLAPYSAYQFKLRASNDNGYVDSGWVRVETLGAAPEYVKRPNLMKNGSWAVIDWTDSFRLNGRLREYLLRADSFLISRGLITMRSVERRNMVINFEVEVVTDEGSAVSPLIVFDPNSVDNVGTVTPALQVNQKPWYEEVWFIIVIVILIVLLLFVIFALCLRRTGPREPYIRERMPLPSADQQKMPRDLYVIDASDGSVIDATLYPDAMPGRNTIYQGPGVGMVNPAYDSTLPRMQTLSIHGSKSSLRGIDDDDGDDITWDRNFDSGLFDDDEDVDSMDNPAYSYTKEQTIFTDTHL